MKLLFKTITAPIHGRQQNELFRKYPHLKNDPRIEQNFDIFNPGKKIGLVIFCGKDNLNVKYFKTSGSLKDLIDLDHTIILVNWANYGYIPEITLAMIEDILIKENIHKINVFGTSNGGYCALELIEDIHKKKLPIKVQSLITIVSPMKFTDFRLVIRLKMLYVRITSAYKLGMRYRKPTNITKNTILTDIKILLISTIGFDPYVNNVSSLKSMQSLFPNTQHLLLKGEPFYRTYAKNVRHKINIVGPHHVHHESKEKLRKSIRKFLSENI